MNVNAPDVERVKAAFREAEAQQAFWEEHYGELREKYPDLFVAVVDSAVVASGPDLQTLLYTLRGQGIAPQQAWVRLVESHPSPLIL